MATNDEPNIFIEGGWRSLDDIPDVLSDILEQVRQQSGPRKLCRYEISDGMVHAGVETLNHWLLNYPRESGAHLSTAIFQAMLAVWECENQKAT